jgi:mannitol/fructose-specific phosphotransferase system IIA component (Ntr-type)
MRVSDLLEPDDIHLHFNSASIIDAVPRLLEPALTRLLHDPQAGKSIVDAVVRREQETSTRCGALALPHARSSAVDRFVVTLGVRDETPRLIFAFVSPEGKREEHLQLLASLARISQNAAVVNAIADAASAGDVIAALRGAGM